MTWEDAYHDWLDASGREVVPVEQAAFKAGFTAAEGDATFEPCSCCLASGCGSAECRCDASDEED